MLPDIEKIKATYKNLPDDKLIRLAITEATSLRPEALDALKAEIRYRGLDEAILRGTDAQFIEAGSTEFETYVDQIRSQPCPVCGSSTQPLNAVIIDTVKSFILLTQYKKKLMIACPTCLQQANQKGTTTTALLGWWGLPWGIIRTTQTLIKNMKTAKQIADPAASDTLISFVKTNIGVIEGNRKNNQPMQNILDSVNKR